MEELGFRVEVNRLVSIIENFNAYEHELLHEFGMYYEVKLLGQLPNDHVQFEGIEKTIKLIFRWICISELEELKVFPKALKELLIDLPPGIKHIVNNDKK